MRGVGANIKSIILSTILIIFHGYGYSQKDETITGFGVDAGIASSKQINSEGGKIISADGKVELVFPAGAVDKPTLISIQQSTNLAPMGLGIAYKLEPSGIEFKQPVKLIWHFTPEEMEEITPDLTLLGVQDHTGKWSVDEYDEIDTLNGTVSINIHHFCWIAKVKMVDLLLSRDSVRVEGKVGLKLKVFHEAYGKYHEALFEKGRPILWFLNGKEKPDEKFGWIKKFVETEDGREEQWAQYHAPVEFFIEKNPVTIRVDLYVGTGQKRVYKKGRSITKQIIVYDVYKAHMFGLLDITATDDNIVGDSASCLVWVYPQKIKITNTVNPPPYIFRESRPIAGCKLKLYSDGGLGIIEARTDFESIDFGQTDPPSVHIHFPDRSKHLAFSFQWICKRYPMPKAPLHTTPFIEDLNFVANGKSQNYEINGPLIRVVYFFDPYRE